MFEDLLSTSDTASQKRNSASNAPPSNFIFETQKNKVINLTSNIIENMKQKEEDLIKIDISQFEFSYPTKPQSFIKTSELGDLAFLYRANKNVVSVCFNRMQYEAAIPLSQVTGFYITDNGKILINMKKNYQHYVNIIILFIVIIIMLLLSCNSKHFIFIVLPSSWRIPVSP